MSVKKKGYVRNLYIQVLPPLRSDAKANNEKRKTKTISDILQKRHYTKGTATLHGLIHTPKRKKHIITNLTGLRLTDDRGFSFK